jgi:hypothetical protein
MKLFEEQWVILLSLLCLAYLTRTYIRLVSRSSPALFFSSTPDEICPSDWNN